MAPRKAAARKPQEPTTPPESDGENTRDTADTGEGPDVQPSVTGRPNDVPIDSPFIQGSTFASRAAARNKRIGSEDASSKS